PMYDFAHPLCDAMQGVTYSICTLEFEDHRPLYNWVVENTGVNGKPRQIEFARLNITNMVMSKRYLKKLVDEKVVSGWDDPRMPTLTGLRNRGVPAEALKNFCEEIGVAKANSEIEIAYLEHFIRDYLNIHAERAMTVFNPIKVVITNYEGEEEVDFDVNPNMEVSPKRKITFGKEIYIDADDFSLCPPPKYFRLQKGGVVRLKNAYIIKCDDVVLDDNGNIAQLNCTYYPDSRSGNDTSGIKCKGTIHWVNAKDCKDVEIRKYDYLLKDAEYSGQDFSERLNYDSLEVINGKTESYIASCDQGISFQLMRKGYYKLFKEDDKLVLSEIVGLKDSFNKTNK
ncbi:MAG: glutamine--tRNA ligase, partial [Clostridia bacterium]|nr:glutamine--tRNA ligase [Clostridia bacterium]